MGNPLKKIVKQRAQSMDRTTYQMNYGKSSFVCPICNGRYDGENQDKHHTLYCLACGWNKK